MSLIAYIPALHKGYVDFFRKYHDGALYVLGEELLREVPRMDRDIRALEPEEIKKAIESWGIFSRVTVLTPQTITELNDMKDEIVMPDEDMSHHFAETYLKGRAVIFVPTFLRWDKQISTKESEVAPDRVISTDAFHREVMGIAEQEAQKSPDWWRQVGGVIVKDRKPILMAHNAPLPSNTFGAFGDPRSNFDAGEHIELSKVLHAETALIARAAKKGIALAGTSLYVTTFPCPVCARSVAHAGIKEAYYAKGYSLLDAEDIFRAFGIKIVLVK